MDTAERASATAPSSGLGSDRAGRPARSTSGSPTRPADGPAALLRHGWPYDINSYAEVTPMLANAGYRVLMPHLRGYRTTRGEPVARVDHGVRQFVPSCTTDPSSLA